MQNRSTTALTRSLRPTWLLALGLLLAGLQGRSQNINTPNKLGPMDIEVNTRTGNLFLQRGDIHVYGRFPISIDFSYNSYDYAQQAGYGNGWSFAFNMRYSVDTGGRVSLIWSDGRTDVYTPHGSSYTPPAGFFDSLFQYQTGKYLLRTTDGMKMYFDNATHRRLTKVQDRNGNALTLSYSDSLVTAITNGAGQAVTLAYNNGRLASITDANATPTQTYTYNYDAYGNLTKVTDPAGGTWQYTYLVNGPMSSAKDKNANVTDLVYYPSFRTRELVSCNTRTSFSYDTTTRTTTVIDFVPSSVNQTTTYVYNEKGWLARFIGSCCGMNTSFAYDNAGNLIERTDGNGHVEKFTYDDRGNILSMTDGLNNTMRMAYTSNFNKLSAFTDAMGNMYAVGYDAAGNPTSLTRPGGSNEARTYAPNGDLLTARDANGNLTSFTYDGLGFPRQVSMPANATIQSTFDGRGNVLSGKDANGNNYTFTYDSLNRLRQIGDALNNTARLLYDKSGNLVSVTDVLGHVRRLSYDASDRMVKFQDATGATATYSYDARNNLVRYTDAIGQSVSYTYDRQNRLTAVTDAAGNGYSVSYDVVGNVSSMVRPNGNGMNYTYDAANRLVSGSDGLGSLGQLAYDANGNVTSYTSPGGAAMTMAYDNLNRIVRVTDPLGNTRSFTYDNDDNLLTQHDRNGNVSSYTYNALNRVTSFTDNNGNSTTAQYDSAGNMTRITDANGNTTAYQYDVLNRPVKMTYPDGHSLSVDYDGNNNMVAVHLADGRIVNYAYDSASRLKKIDMPDGEQYTYSYDASGQLLSAGNAAGTISFAYDGAGRPILETFNSRSLHYNYNRSASTMTIIYPGGDVINKIFDLRGRLGSVNANNRQLSSYQYNNENELSAKSFGNGVSTNYEYDASRRLVRLSGNGSGLPSLSIQYDNEGNKLRIERTSDQSYSETFAYDANYRLTAYRQGMMSGNSIPSPTVSNSYVYDAVGNRTSATLNGTVTSFTVNSLNQYTHAGGAINTNYTYDQNGNLTFDGRFYMRYDVLNRKIADSAAPNLVYTYLYDAFGRRVVRSMNGVAVNDSYLGLNAIEERNANDSVLSTEVFEAAYHPLTRVFAHHPYFYHGNDLGSTEAMTDSTGAVIERYRYEDFGKTAMLDAQGNAISSSSIHNRYLFTGQEQDPTGEYTFHFRSYNTATGAFNQRDPLGYADQMGAYQYTGNNPGTYVDPLGLTPCPQKQTWSEWLSDKAFWPGEYSNLGSVLQIFESMPRTFHTAYHLVPVEIELFGNQHWGFEKVPFLKADQPGMLAQASKVVNSSGLTKALMPFNIVNTAIPAYNLATRGDQMGGAEVLDNSMSLVSGGATTAVGTVSLASPGALSASALAGAPVLAGVVATAGGLGLYGLTDLGFRGATGLLGAMGLKDGGSESIIGFSGSHDIPIYTDAVRGYYQQLGVSEDVGNRFYQRSMGRLKKWDEVRKRMEDRQAQWAFEHLLSRFRNGDCPPDGGGGTQKPPPRNIDEFLKFLTELIFNHDPNAIIGPDGVGPKKWVSVHDQLPYQVLFENDSMATAPVKVVKVSYPIDPKQDPNTFKLGSFGFNSLTFTVPDGLNSYYQRLDVRDSLGLYVDVTAGLDGVNHRAFWIFESIDPITLMPTTDPLKGFLLKRDSANTSAGNGFVNFSIRPVSDAHTGDTMSAYASIVFDSNDSMLTNHAFNTIDALPPTTHLAAAQTITPSTFQLSWSGQDDAGGSGLQSYSLYVATNGGPFRLYQSQLTANSMLFTGAPDSTYCFFIAGVDSVKNEEPLSNHCDLSVSGVGTPLPLTWLDFTGSRRGDDALLLWTTANEQRTSVFLVERSLNGVAFSPVGSVPAGGTTTDLRHYHFTDPGIVNLGVSIVYYRIREVDVDGRSSYTRIVAIRIDKTAQAPSVSAFPNPFDRELTLKVVPASDADRTETVELYSIQGIRLYRREIGRTGIAVITLNDLPNLAAGVYILRTTVNGVAYTTKLVKNN